MNSLGLYLHVPFCRRRCLYCDFYSTQDLALTQAFTDEICRELARASDLYGNRPVETVYFGGGTPSLLSTAQLEQILFTVAGHFSLAQPQITLEANPATLAEQDLGALRSMGVDRISLGMQSAIDTELLAIGRLHSARQALDSARAVERAGFAHLSLDLMYGLPGQTRESFAASLQAALSTGADHLSTYCLTLAPHVPLAATHRPDEELEQALYTQCHTTLAEKGFTQYEISNFALTEGESRHNQRYWDRRPVLGFGPGAHSFDGQRRWYNQEDLHAYVKNGPLVCEPQTLSPQDVWEETVMLSLRTARGLSYDRLLPLLPDGYLRIAAWEPKLTLWQELGLIKKSPQGFALTPQGFFVSNTILADLI